MSIAPRVATEPMRPHAGRLLKMLRDRGPTSRTGLAELTGLSPTTISKVINPLVDRGLLQESVAEVRRLGRPAVTLTPVPQAVTVCGVQIGVGTVRIGLSDASGAVRAVTTHAFSPNLPADQVIGLIADSVRSTLDGDDGAACTGIGVGVPGPIDDHHRRVLLSNNLAWRDVAMADELERRLGVATVVDHNVQAMALSETRYGQRVGDSLAYLYVRTGVGLGVASRHDDTYTWPIGESFLGHVRAVENGTVCSCGGRGCLDTVVAEPYLRASLAQIVGSVDPEQDVLTALHAASRSGIAEATVLVDEVIVHLAAALGIVVNLFTPDQVLLGGILAEAPNVIVDRLRERVRDRIFPLLRDDLRMDKADAGDEAMVRSGAAVALELLHYS